MHLGGLERICAENGACGHAVGESLTVADSLYNMSMLYEKMQLHSEALDACERSLALAVTCGGRHHPSAVEARDLLHELQSLVTRHPKP